MVSRALTAGQCARYKLMYKRMYMYIFIFKLFFDPLDACLCLHNNR